MATEILTILRQYIKDDPVYVILVVICFLGVTFFRWKAKELERYIGRVEKNTNKNVDEIKQDAHEREERVLAAIEGYRTYKEDVVERLGEKAYKDHGRISRLEGEHYKSHGKDD